MPYSTRQEAQAYHPAAGGQDAKAIDVLADAADMVQRIAPTPEAPVPDEYKTRAARAERRVFAYLWDTGGGYITGSSLSGVSSESFTGIEGVRSVIESVMGKYATVGRAASSSSSYSLGIESSFDPVPLDELPRP